MKKDVITDLKKLAWAEALFPGLANYQPVVERFVRRGVMTLPQQLSTRKSTTTLDPVGVKSENSKGSEKKEGSN